MSVEYVRRLFDKLLLGDVDAVKIPFDNFKQREAVRTLLYRERTKFREIDMNAADSILISRGREGETFYVIVTTASFEGSWFKNITGYKGSEQTRIDLSAEEVPDEF